MTTSNQQTVALKPDLDLRLAQAWLHVHMTGTG